MKSYSATGHGGIFDIEWQGNWLAAGNSQGRIIVFEFNEDEIESNSREGDDHNDNDNEEEERLRHLKTSFEIASEHDVLTSDLVIETSDTIINNEPTTPDKIVIVSSITQEQEQEQEQENNNDMIE